MHTSHQDAARSNVSNLLKINSLLISGPSMGVKLPDISERLRNVGAMAYCYELTITL